MSPKSAFCKGSVFVQVGFWLATLAGAIAQQRVAQHCRNASPPLPLQ